MRQTIVVLSEQALTSGDVQTITGLHSGEPVQYVIVVPEDSRTNLLTAILDDLSLFDLRKLISDLRPDDGADRQRDAADKVSRSLAALHAAGAQAEGGVTAKQPLAALGEAVERYRPREIVVVTRPHAVEDTLHTDWASIARETLGLPVLHLYGGTGRAG